MPDSITPPTPDLDAVVARVSALATMHAATPDTNARAVAADLRTLLAAVSRPAEARGEPSEAMVEAYRDADMCADSLLDTHTAHWCPKCITSGLRAALAVQRGNP